MNDRPESVRRDHDRVEPGDAIGVAIRVPNDRASIVAELLAPSVSAELVLGLSGPLTIYATVGTDSLNGRRVPHRWVNLITDPPAGVPSDEGLGGLACIGSPSSAVNQMCYMLGGP